MNDELAIDDKVILIRINKLYHDLMTEEEMYEATRGIWRMNRNRGEKADYAFTVYKGIVREIYEIESWATACTSTYKTRNMKDAISQVKRKGRYEFTGKIADHNIRNKYIDKSVKGYFKHGEANPIKYINC